MTLMSLLVETSLKASLVMLVALAAVTCLRRQSAALRHWMLSAAIVAALAAPLAGLVIPSWHLPLDALPRPRLIATPAPAAAASVPRSSAPRRTPLSPDSTSFSRPHGWPERGSASSCCWSGWDGSPGSTPRHDG
jgi:hypothetical protein